MADRQLPFGYDLCESEEEQELINDILQMRSDGMSQNAIVKQLNEEGRLIRGRKWQQGTLSRILSRYDNS